MIRKVCKHIVKSKRCRREWRRVQEWPNHCPRPVFLRSQDQVIAVVVMVVVMMVMVMVMVMVVMMKDPADLLIFTEYADFCLSRC